MSNHYLSQCNIIVDYNLRKKFQKYFDKYATIFLQENWFENAAVWQPLCSVRGVLICIYWQKTGNLCFNVCSYLKIPLKMAIFRIALNTYVFMYSCISHISMFKMIHFSFFIAFCYQSTYHGLGYIYLTIYTYSILLYTSVFLLFYTFCILLCF